MNKPTDEQPQPPSSLGRLYAVVFSGLVGQLILQFILQKLLTSTLGAGAELDAYRVSLTVPTAISAIIAGTISPIILPVMSQDNSTRSATIGGLVYLIVAISTLVIATVLFLFRCQTIAVLQPGYDEDMVELTANVFAILIWLLPANALIGITQSMLNARLRFFVPSLAGVLGPMTTVFVYHRYADQGGGEIIAWATLVGAAANLLVQFPFLLPVLRFRHFREQLPELKRLSLLALPILTGMFFLHAIQIVDKYVLSELEIGSMTRYDLAYQFLNAFIMLASGTLSTVAFPRIAQHANLRDQEMRYEIARALRGLIILVVPAVAVLAVFGELLIQQMFESGEFLRRDTLVVGQLLRIFAFMIIGAALGELATKTLYALQKTRIPLYVSSVMITGCCVAKIILVPDYGINSAALITTITYLLSASVLLGIVYKLTGIEIFKGTHTTLLVALSAAAGACGMGYAIVQISVPLSSLWGLCGGAIIYFSIVGIASLEFREMVYLMLKKKQDESV